MPLSKVIRIDEQVWAELQKLARPLEDTPNSVLRRVFGLSEEGEGAGGLDARVNKLLGLVQEAVGEAPQVFRVRKDYSFSSRSGGVAAYIRPQQQKLRVGVSKESATATGLRGWDTERNDGFFGGPGVRWYIPDGDDSAYRRAAQLLEKLWRNEVSATPLT
ncbi:MAG TPA: hypothetical protein VFR55_08595 [Dehalococcoidia bacterium]|nr:hypothetical protein [Dehalococcoidia bacterium]